MDLYDNAPVERMWFGTEQKMGWIDTPETGADVSSIGQSANAVLQNGGGTVRNSWDSHKVYQFSWGTGASQRMVALLQAYRNGSYGRGLLYFHDPMYYATNLLPKRWADPSMAVNWEAEPLIPDANPTAVPVVSTEANYPVTAASYTVPAGFSSQTAGVEHFIPIPEGMVLVLGAVYSGSAKMYVRTPAGVTDLISLSSASNKVVNTVIRNQPWARLGIRNTSGSAAPIIITGATARLAATVSPDGGTSFSYTNILTNPSFESAGAAVEVRRNLATNPRGLNTIGWSSNNATINPVTRGVTPPVPHPLGITTAVEQSSTGTNAALVSMYNIDSLGAPGTPERTFGVWILITEAGYSSNGVSIPANVWTFVRGSAVVPAAGLASLLALRDSGNASTTVRAYVTGAIVEAGTTPVGTYFDGGVQASPDPDLTAAWVGASGASASTLSGVSVPGVSLSIGVVAIRSSRWSKEGSFSLRLIPTSATDNVSFVSLSGGTPQRGTFIVTRRLAAPITGSTWSTGFGRAYWSPAPNFFSDPAPNVVGEAELRVYAPSGSVASSIILPHGGLRGSGDVWYDLAAIIEGTNYAGPAFSGSTPGAVWNGTTNASTSTLAGVTPIAESIADGPWMSGEGHSGCHFQGNPTVINYNGVNGGQIGLSAVLQEVGAWE